MVIMVVLKIFSRYFLSGIRQILRRTQNQSYSFLYSLESNILTSEWVYVWKLERKIVLRNFKQVNKLEKYFQSEGKILSSTSCNRLYSNATFSHFNNKFLFTLNTHEKNEPKKQTVPRKYARQCQFSKNLERHTVIFQRSDSKYNSYFKSLWEKNWFPKTLRF